MTRLPDDTWTVAVHVGPDDLEPIGTGVVIAADQVLTCSHVLVRDGRPLEEVWLAFPKARNVGRERRPARPVINGRHDDRNVDIALLQLAQEVPPSVRPARLRCLPAPDLYDDTWWAFGFPDRSELGSAVEGVAGASLAYGGLHLVVSGAPGIKQGFSGGAIWSYGYEAVVGLVIAAHPDGNGAALTLGHADEQLPELKLSVLAGWQAEDAGDAALAAWGWMLRDDREAPRHWLPRARGVASDSERGSLFRGRAAALRTIVSWLDDPEPSGRVLVVTGSPGVGKSAVLGRIVTTADAAVRAALPPDDTAETATVGSVSCAVHAKGKGALEVAREIARAASVELPRTEPEDLIPALRQRLGGGRARFNLIVDALDEASSPGQARALVALGRELARLGVQVVMGTRRADDSGDLLAEFGPAAEVVDLDDPGYFAESDLTAYALATLMGADRPDNPYSDVRAAEPVARRIAGLSQHNFLVAGLVARARGLRDTVAVDPGDVTFEATVADALDRYVDVLPAAGWTPARTALTALAHAETPGLPISLWRTAVEALGGQVTEEELTYFARTSAANFLVESGGAAAPAYRLFHQALNEALLGAGEGDERLVTAAWLADGQRTGWEQAPAYLLRSLATHAARTRMIDELLADNEYLLYADPDRLRPAAEAATSRLGTERAQLLNRTRHVAERSGAERAALFSVVEKLDALGSGLGVPAQAPYAAHWARTPRRLETSVLEGHSDAVCDVAAIPVEGRTLLASAGEDGDVLLWDPVISRTENKINIPDECVRGLAAVRAGGVHLLATGGHDSVVRLWDPRPQGGRLVHALTGHTDWVRNLCAVTLPDGSDLLVSGSDDRTVRLWDPVTGTLVRTLRGHSGWVTAVCRAGELVASAGFDATVRLWNPVTGELVAVLEGHTGWITTLYAVGDLVASAGYDGTVRLWDPRRSRAVRTFDAEAGLLTDLCTLRTPDGGLLLAVTAEDGSIRLWDMATMTQRRPIEGYASWMRAVCELPIGGRHLLATAGDDGTVRLWDTATGRTESVMDGGRLGPVQALAEVRTTVGTLVASTGGEGTVRLWNPATGEQPLEPLVAYGTTITGVAGLADTDGRPLAAVSSEDRSVRVWDVEGREVLVRLRRHHERVNAVVAIGGFIASASDDEIVRIWDPRRESARPLIGHAAWVTALARVRRGDQELLVSADKAGMLRLWDLEGELLRETQGHVDAVNAVTALPLADQELLVSAGDDRTVRLWDTGELGPVRVLAGHTAPVTGVCAMPFAGRPAVVSASRDRTVRIWDAGTGRLVRVIPVYHPALSCLFVDGVLMVGLDRGLLALDVR